MKYEQLYRAKKFKTNDWIEGSLITVLVDGKKAYMIAPIQEVTTDNNIEESTISYTINEDIFIVDPDTISRYTGSIDKNENKIWEGDILEILGSRYEVCWDATNLTYVIVNGKNCLKLYYQMMKFSIVGNIYDKINTELYENE